MSIHGGLHYTIHTYMDEGPLNVQIQFWLVDNCWSKGVDLLFGGSMVNVHIITFTFKKGHRQ